MIELGCTGNRRQFNNPAASEPRAYVAYALFQNGILLEVPSRWLRSIARSQRKSPHTVKTYASCLKSFFEWLDNRSSLRQLEATVALLTTTRFDIENWIQDQRAAALSLNTIRLREVVVRELFTWLTTDDGQRLFSEVQTPYRPTPTDLRGELISAKAPRIRPRKFTNKQLVSLIGAYHNESERVLTHFLYDCGLRISEASRMLKSELPCESHYEDGQKYYPLYVRGSKARDSGGNTSSRVTIISAPTLARIRRYHNSHAYRFSPHFKHDDPDKPCFLQVNGAQLNADNVRKQLKAAARRAKLNPLHFSPHKFRHGCAYGILQSELGNDYFDRLILAQSFLGHAQITTTEIYAQFSPAVLKALHESKATLDKYEEQKEIYELTYLGRAREIERRGHRKS